jgi:uncharacterized protein YukE
MPTAQPSNNGTFQVNSNDLVSTYPLFYSAGNDIHDAATNLNNALTKAISSFDGDTQKKLQSLGNNCVTNLKNLSGALNEIASRLQQSSNAVQNVEGTNVHRF